MNNSLLIYIAKNSKLKLEMYSDFFIARIRSCCRKMCMVSKEKLDADFDFQILENNLENPLQVYWTAIQMLGWDQIRQFERIVCVSDDLMGPLYDLDSVFDEMQSRQLDCWSLTKQHRTPMNYLDYTGENLQAEYLHTEFIVLESSLIQSTKIGSIFAKSVIQENLRDSWIDSKALEFSGLLSKYGFSFDSYVETSDLSEIYYNPLLLCPKRIITEKQCPVFTRKSFSGEYVDIISNTMGNPGRELLEYLENETSYDIDMIWDTILKNDNQQDIYNNLHLNYILDSKCSDYSKTKRILEKKKIALVMHLYFMDLLDKSFHYAECFPEYGDIYITTNTEDKRHAIEKAFRTIKCNKFQVRIIENRGRDVSALLTGVKDVIMLYDYVCFVHDKKSAQLVPGSIGQEFGSQCLENTLGSRDFVNNVINTLYDNKRLGLLSPIYPIHGSYYAVHGNIDWAGNFNNTRDLAMKLGIDVPMHADKSPVAPLGTMFWFKPPALEPLFSCDWKYDDFPEEPNGVDGTLLHAIERMYAFATQHAGYYPAVVSNEVFANITQTNLAVFLQGINRSLERYAAYFSFQQSINIIDSMIYEVGLLKNNNYILSEECERLRTQILLMNNSQKLALNDKKRNYKMQIKRWIHREK